MKKILIHICFLFLAIVSNAQAHDLNYFIEQAQTNSPLINKAKNQNQLLQLDIKQIKNILSKPNINLDGNLLFSPIITHDNGNKFQFVSDGYTTDYTGYDLAYTDGGQYQAFISVKQPLFMGGRYKAYYYKADVQTQLNENNINLSWHELEQLVVYQYLICLKTKKQKEISDTLLSQLDEQVNIMRKLVDNAIYEPSDLMLLQIEQKNYKINYLNFSNQYKSDLADLNVLCGISDTNSFDIADVDFPIKPDTVVQSQFLRKYYLDSLNIKAEQNIFNQRYKPQLNLFANMGLNAIYLPSVNRFGLAAGLNFTLNIFDGNQKKINENKVLIKMQTLNFEKQNVINQYQTQKDKYLRQIQLIGNQTKIVKEQLSEYQKLVKVYKIKLSQGELSIMDIKNIIRDIASKKQELLLLQMQKKSLINDYNYWNY